MSGPASHMRKPEALRLRLPGLFLFFPPIAVFPGLDPLVGGGLSVRRDDPLLSDLFSRKPPLLDEEAGAARVFPVEGAPFGEGEEFTRVHVEAPP